MTAAHNKHKDVADVSVQKTDDASGTDNITSDIPVQSAPVQSGQAVVPPQSTPPIIEPAQAPLTQIQTNETNELNKDFNQGEKKNFLLPIIFVVLLALAFYGGIFVYKKFFIKNEDAKTNIVTLSPTPKIVQPTPTIEEIDLSKYEIKILNGSEVEGEAGRQKTNLENEGFTISSIGNAETSDYTSTIIQAKKDVETEFLDKLKTIFETSFASSKIEDLSEDSAADVIVILGTKK